ncbi:unnamed protein product [Schistocephalus solidus]|uniref:Uncharacterized protein n=1 Tax=Schistocephalus solidus TaxID=70667 RepID=A0A183SFU0_SCHSO|nr:unnamed protein product [Schistocephalus solidus]
MQCEKTLAYPFLKRKVKREWIVLDEISLKVLAFADEESSVKPKREPLYSISMVNAVLKIESSEDNVFSITSIRARPVYIAFGREHSPRGASVSTGGVPGSPLPHREAKECVGQQKTVFRTRWQKKEAFIVAATETIDPSPRSCRASKAVEITGEPEDAVSSSTDAGMEGRFLNLAGGGARNSSGEIHLIRSTSRDYVFTSAKTASMMTTNANPCQNQRNWTFKSNDLEQLLAYFEWEDETHVNLVPDIISVGTSKMELRVSQGARILRIFASTAVLLLFAPSFQTLELTEAYFREALARRMASSMDSASGSLCSPNPDANKSKER